MPATSPSYQALPQHLSSGMRDFIEYGIRPDHFLMAVLTNNLREAVGLADSSISIQQIKDICTWLMWECPVLAHGDEARVTAWIHKGGRVGIDRMVAELRAAEVQA